MRLWGLTGGIASGKSTVSAMLAAAGVPTLSADATYHRLLAPQGGRPSPLAAAVAAGLGGGLLGAQGELDRAALGRRVFGADAASRDARARLGRLTHPAIAAEVAREVARLSAGGHARVVYDAPLLLEGGGASRVDGLLVVWVPVACQLQRLALRDRLDATAARARLAAQMPLDAKRLWADWVVDNAGSPEATRRQVNGWLRWTAPPAR